MGSIEVIGQGLPVSFTVLATYLHFPSNLQIMYGHLQGISTVGPGHSKVSFAATGLRSHGGKERQSHQSQSTVPNDRI